MKILWVSEVHPDPNSGAGGTELHMVNELKKLGHDVTTIWANDLPRRISHGNIHYALELPRTYASAILAACERSRYDVVTVNLGQSYLACKRLRQSGFDGIFVVRSHGLDDHLNETLRQWTKKLGLQPYPSIRSLLGQIPARIADLHIGRASRVCDGYIVSNSLDAEFLHQRHRLHQDRIAVIPQAPAEPFLASFAPQMNTNRLRRILYVANFHFAKGPHAVAAAARELLEQDDSLSLTWICHQADHSTVLSLLGDLSNRVQLRGWIPQEDLVAEFDKHGIFLYPSLFDGFGKVFLEAMARGLCVIGTQAGGMVDILHDGVNGVICDGNSPEQIVRSVRDLLEKPEEAVRLSAAASKTAKLFTWERVGKELEEFFSQRQDSKRAVDQLLVASS